MDRKDDFIAHLDNENEFKTVHRVPTLSKDHAEYNPAGGYWCGSVWSPTNYMVLKGLDEYKEHALAHEIALSHLDAVVSVFVNRGTLYENYAPEQVDGKFEKGSSSMADFVGWTGLSPISILFEYVFGIKPDASENKITWHINLLEKHGVQKYPFGIDGELTLICEERSSEEEKPQVTIKSNVPVEVEIIWNKEQNRELISF